MGHWEQLGVENRKERERRAKMATLAAEARQIDEWDAHHRRLACFSGDKALGFRPSLRSRLARRRRHAILGRAPGR